MPNSLFIGRRAKKSFVDFRASLSNCLKINGKIISNFRSRSEFVRRLV